MSPPPRALSFTVSTSLLSASLALGTAGCDDSQPTVNPAPESDGKSDGKTPETEVVTVNPVPEVLPEPEPAPEKAPEERVNEGPEPDPKPVAEPEIPKRVNTPAPRD